jgi:hypothetical protein
MTEPAGTRREIVAQRDLARQQRKADLVARRAEVQAAKKQAEADRARRRQQDEARLAAEESSRQAIAARAFEHYVRVREYLRAIRATQPPASLTAAEQRTLSGLEHLWEATPDTIARLRRWCEPITGVRVADYEPPSPDLILRIKRDYRVLRRQVGAELFVAESPALAGFGFPRGSDLVNEDTLKYFSVLVALQDAAVLATCRTAERRIVWEIGGGWGGFAYQFKTICPNVTYVITARPDVMLVSAVYLMTVFPHARHRFFGEGTSGNLWTNWQDVDFLFVPESAVAALQPPRVDLTLDLMALPAMDTGRVRAHVRRAYELGCPYFYSLLPAASGGDEVSRVWGSIERWYWPHPVPPRAENMPPVVDGAASAPPEAEYAHLVGWRRLRA